ncbi:zinc-binding dehydrogenase [Gilvimarinus agarilyticus]|uniref:zinc-binding dehydrogenase n=1 Tax=Gilvimarinus agarilyticus TaxID=679259 RepID=UPI0005A2E56F|nr:zinc-binding dehydrogenase [Gilvimarinus agarilyticus]
MKALVYQVSTDDFLVQDIPEPVAYGYDVKVRVLATGLNPVDSKVNLWYQSVFDQTTPFVGGLDVAGEIVALGDKVTGWNLGDKVLYHGNMFRSCGGFAEYTLHDSRTLTQMPAISPFVAAATPCAGWTALHALKNKLNVDRRNSILITGGAGGVGTFAIQLAKFYGVRAIITTASAAKHAYVTSLGATHAIDYQHEDVVTKVREITDNAGVEIALDAAGGDNDVLCANSLGFEGELCGLVRTLRPEQYANSFSLGLSFHQLSLGSAHTHNPSLLLELGNDFSHLLEAKHIACTELNSVGFTELSEAMRALRQKSVLGKLVFVPN